MNIESKESVSPAERLSAALAQFALNINNLQTFYGTTTDLLEIGKDQAEHKLLKTSKVEIAKPEVQQILGAENCNSLMQNEGLFNFILKSVAIRSVRLSKQMVGSATLVFAHTILDELLSECCYISFEAAPSEWYPFIGDRKIEVRALLAADTQEIIHQKALELVREKASQSMVKRFNLLNQICVPRLNGEKPSTALVDVEKLDAFDQLRHKIIHGQPFSQTISEVEDKVLLVACFGMATLGLVGKAYKLFDKGNFSKEGLMSKVMAGVIDDLPEFSGLFAALNKTTELMKTLPK